VLALSGEAGNTELLSLQAETTLALSSCRDSVVRYQLAHFSPRLFLWREHVLVFLY
jgi:hypothetical protein